MKQLLKMLLAACFLLALLPAGAADLPLGPGDLIKISVYNNPDLGLETRVSETGNITFPLVGSFDVGGMPVSAAEKKLSGLLESGGFIRKAQVNIIVETTTSQQVSVIGQVNRPGRYPLDGKRSVLDFLALAGGFGPDAGDSVILVHRQGGVTTKTNIDIVSMVRNAELKSDVELSGNDVIYVERAPHFYIYGEVQRPGVFRLDRDMTVLQALAVGGGLTPRGTERNIRIKRRDAGGKMQVISAKHDDLLQTDDVVFVQESWF